MERFSDTYVRSFYESVGIVPGKNVSDVIAINLISASRMISSYLENPFETFVALSLIKNPEIKTYRLNFESWDELLMCYCSFMDGYVGNVYGK